MLLGSLSSLTTELLSFGAPPFSPVFKSVGWLRKEGGSDCTFREGVLTSGAWLPLLGGGLLLPLSYWIEGWAKLDDILEEPIKEDYCASCFNSNCYFACSEVLAITRLKKKTYEFCYCLHSLMKNESASLNSSSLSTEINSPSEST